MVVCLTKANCSAEAGKIFVDNKDIEQVLFPDTCSKLCIYHN